MVPSRTSFCECWVVIESTIVRLADQFLEADDYVLLPTDTHQPNDQFHPEHKLFPEHNLAGSWGHELYGKLASWYTTNKENKRVWQFAKNRYSAFQNTNLDNYGSTLNPVDMVKC